MVRQERGDVAVAVAAWRFDLDDARAQVRQQARAEWSGKRHRTVYDSEVFEWAAAG